MGLLGSDPELVGTTGTARCTSHAAAFDYSYAQIADIVQATEPAVRQLVSRARKHMTRERHAPVSAAAQRELLTAFIAAARTGEMAAGAGCSPIGYFAGGGFSGSHSCRRVVPSCASGPGRSVSFSSRTPQ